MKRNLFVLLSLVCSLSLSAGFSFAQDPDSAPAEDLESVELEPTLEYSDYTIKGYSLSFFGGQFSGATYLENQKLTDRTVFTLGANDIMGFDGETLPQSQDFHHWDAAHKTIEAGPAYGARIGVYINDDFHLDIVGVYGTANATISMLQIASLDGDPNFEERRVDLMTDDNFKMYKGGFAFQYDANSAKFFGLRPQIGFGIGGIINRYNVLPDETALYLDGYLGLDFPITDKLNASIGADLSIFAFNVEELGYSNMVSYKTYHVGLSYFFDVLPKTVRSEHIAEKQKKK